MPQLPFFTGKLWIRLVALACLCLLSACHVSNKHIQLAEHYMNASREIAPPCQHKDNCAMKSELMQQAYKAFADSKSTAPVHYVTLLDHAETALAARLNLIASARHSIDLQTYIWGEDDAGDVMLDALVKAAQRGVRVRILADQLFAFANNEKLAQLARTSANLSIRMYNPTFQKAHTSTLEFAAGIICCFKRFNQRMHNKLLLVDNVIGITGGRNYEDRYFGWDADFNYRDRDVIVAGPAAHTMASTFTQFWQHKRSKPLSHLRDVNKQIRKDDGGGKRWQTPTYDHPLRVKRVHEEAYSQDWIKEHILDHSLKVGKVDYFSDFPKKTADPKRKQARLYTRHIMHMVAAAENSVVIQTPYLVLSKRAQRIFKHLQQREHPPRIIVSTNSLATTDAFVSYAMSYKYKKRYLKNYGFEIYELKPHPANASLSIAPPLQPNASDDQDQDSPHRVDSYQYLRGPRAHPAPLVNKDIRIGLHAKSIVVDDHFAMVGTHNFDPRSDNYNTESGIIVYDKAFANAVRTQILRDTQVAMAWTIAPRPETIPILSDISRGLGNISAHLPWFDLWPFRYATSFEINAGCRPMAPSDPDFYSCYHAVGDFPGVDLPLKTIYTRFATGFGYGVNGIL